MLILTVQNLLLINLIKEYEEIYLHLVFVLLASAAHLLIDGHYGMIKIMNCTDAVRRQLFLMSRCYG